MMSYDNLIDPVEAAATGVHAPAPFALLTVRGPDAGSFVHRLSSQDVTGLAEGSAAPAAFLTAKGRLETLAWVARHADQVWIEVQAHELDKLAGLLDRYHFAERIAIEPMRTWQAVQIVGPGAWDRVSATACTASVEDAPLWFAGQCRGLRWVRWHGEAASLPALAGEAIDEAAWQRLRIAAGLPWLGIDVDAKTLALEADIDDHVSTTKGCYTGQEIVARIHTYGHTNRKLCRLKITPRGDAALAAGASIVDDEGDPVGRVTSLASARLDADPMLGLGYLPREVAVVGSKLALQEGGDVLVV